MTNPNAPKATTLNVTLAITHVDGTQPSMAEVLAWLNRCVNCNPNHARVEIHSEPVVATAASAALPVASSDALGPMSDEQYLARKGIRCPSCRGDNLTGDHVEINGETAYQPVYCSDCEATWNDEYALTGYSTLEGGVDFQEVQQVLDQIQTRCARLGLTVDTEGMARKVADDTCEVLDMHLTAGAKNVLVKKLLR